MYFLMVNGIWVVIFFSFQLLFQRKVWSWAWRGYLKLKVEKVLFCFGKWPKQVHHLRGITGVKGHLENIVLLLLVLAAPFGTTAYIPHSSSLPHVRWVKMQGNEAISHFLQACLNISSIILFRSLQWLSVPYNFHRNRRDDR